MLDKPAATLGRHSTNPTPTAVTIIASVSHLTPPASRDLSLLNHLNLHPISGPPPQKTRFVSKNPLLRAIRHPSRPDAARRRTPTSPRPLSRLPTGLSHGSIARADQQFAPKKQPHQPTKSTAPLPQKIRPLPTSHFPLPTSHFPLPTSHFPTPRTAQNRGLDYHGRKAIFPRVPYILRVRSR